MTNFYKDIKIYNNAKQLSQTEIYKHKQTTKKHLLHNKHDLAIKHLNSIFFSTRKPTSYDRNIYLPYDDNVSLQFDIEYVNASFVETDLDITYIAAQLPRPEYRSRFLELVSKAGVNLIVSLFKFENRSENDYFNGISRVKSIDFDTKRILELYSLRTNVNSSCSNNVLKKVNPLKDDDLLISNTEEINSYKNSDSIDSKYKDDDKIINNSYKESSKNILHKIEENEINYNTKSNTKKMKKLQKKVYASFKVIYESYTDFINDNKLNENKTTKNNNSDQLQENRDLIKNINPFHLNKPVSYTNALEITDIQNNSIVYKSELFLINKKTIQPIAFNEWKDFHETNLFYLESFSQFVDQQARKDAKYVLVHCLAGIGRTGTFIMYNILRNYESVSVDFFIDVLYYLRSKRNGMVYNERQLKFLYSTFINEDG